MLLLTLTHDADAQLHIFKVVADDGDDKDDSTDAADLASRSERLGESHSSCKPPRYCWHLLHRLPRVPAMSLRTDKQRMLRQRIEQAQAEVKVAQQQLASYRAYQQRELDEVRQATAELNRLQLP